MTIFEIIEIFLALVLLFLIVFAVFSLIKFFLIKSGIKMKHIPNFIGMIIGPFDTDRFFFTDTFIGIKNDNLRNLINVIFSWFINVIAIALSLIILFGLIYLISYFNH